MEETPQKIPSASMIFKTKFEKFGFAELKVPVR
jgi:hypothetical protein